MSLLPHSIHWVKGEILELSVPASITNSTINDNKD